MLCEARTCNGADLRQRPPRAAARACGKGQKALHLQAQARTSAATGVHACHCSQTQQLPDYRSPITGFVCNARPRLGMGSILAQ